MPSLIEVPDDRVIKSSSFESSHEIHLGKLVGMLFRFFVVTISKKLNVSFHITLAIFWILYVVFHSILAALWFKDLVSKIAGTYFKFYRLLYSYIFSIALIMLVVYHFKGESFYLFSPVFSLRAIGIIGAIGGSIIMAACIKKYFANLSGIDVFMKRSRPPVLELHGLHEYVRHPLYSGTLLFIWSLFLLFPLFSNLIVCVIITVYVLIGIRLEERKLKMEFGDSYIKYAHKTPMLIPFLRRKL